MENILEKIVANKRIEVNNIKEECSLTDLIRKITDEKRASRMGFKVSLLESSSGIIAEFKRRSPSRGWIFEDADVVDIVPNYSKNGAAAISVLTDLNFFGGSLSDLSKAKELTKVPILRKDFVVDEYQIYEAALYGASAVLLIAAALSVEEVKLFGIKAKELGLDVLLEIHNEKELDCLNEYVDIVGVNNRNLGSFETDIRISFDLADKIPADFLKISESGIAVPQTVLDLREVGYRGFLMGENFMKTNDPGKTLKKFIKELKL